LLQIYRQKKEAHERDMMMQQSEHHQNQQEEQHRAMLPAAAADKLLADIQHMRSEPQLTLQHYDVCITAI